MSVATDTPRSLRILVADDEAWVRELLHKHLEGLGHVVVCARDGNEALEILDREEFDRVFLDVMMPYHNPDASTNHLATTALRAMPVTIGP